MSDLDYFRYRLACETRMAERATNAYAETVHRDLAARYAQCALREAHFAEAQGSNLALWHERDSASAHMRYDQRAG